MDGTEVVAHGSRFALALVLAAAGVAKVANIADFRSAVSNYGLVPASLVRPLARAIPSVEILAAALLLVGVLPHLVGLGAAALLLVFTVAVVINLARGRVLDCGCFGSAAPRRLTWWTVARNLALVGMALGVFGGRPDGLAAFSGGAATGPPPPPHEVLATAALAFIAVMAAFVVAEAAAVRTRLRALAGANGEAR